MLAFCTQCDSCRDEPVKQGQPPPPSASASKNDVCAPGGGEDNDVVSAPFFARVHPVPGAGGGAAGAWCLDPQGDAKSYGDKGKLGMRLICETALDGGCEEYIRLGVTRTVVLHYVEGKGAGTIEVFLSQFAGDGAYALMTARIVGEVDPTDPSMPHPISVAKSGVGALGTGKAYAWRGSHFLELTYSNDNQTPEQLKKSSDDVLPGLAKAIAEKLPETPEIPDDARLLPPGDRVPFGVVFDPKAILGMANVGRGAVGYYKNGNKRWRILATLRPDIDQGKDVFKSLKQAGATTIPNIGDEAMLVLLHPGPSRPKLEFAIARTKGVVVGVGDEEFLLSSNGAAPPPAKSGDIELTKDEKIEKLKNLVEAIATGLKPN